MRRYILFFVFIVLSAGDGIAGQKYTIHRTIRYSFTVYNRMNRAADTAEFWTYAPVKQTATQRCTALVVSHPHRLTEDGEGNRILRFTFRKMPPFSRKIIRIKADLLLSEQPNNVPVSKELLKFYRLPEPCIESGDHSLVRLARQLSAGNTFQTARNIFHWVSDNITYSGYTSNNRGALYALNNRKGDCTEFMYLFVALCRANAIPARCIGGYICKESRILDPAEMHNWPEYYMNDRWNTVDPQNKMFDKEAVNYIAMNILSCHGKNTETGFHRFKCSGEGIEAEMNK